MSFVYVASPYSGTPEEMEERFKAVENYTAKQMKKGFVIFSPIVHCHAIAANHDLPTDFNFWQSYCLGMLESADSLDVFMLPGWDESKGVTSEIEYAKKLGIEIHYIKYDTYEVLASESI